MMVKDMAHSDGAENVDDNGVLIQLKESMQQTFMLSTLRYLKNFTEATGHIKVVLRMGVDVLLEAESNMGLAQRYPCVNRSRICKDAPRPLATHKRNGVSNDVAVMLGTYEYKVLCCLLMVLVTCLVDYASERNTSLTKVLSRRAARSVHSPR